MSAILRGGKNAFRNPVRTIAVVLIVGLSIGIALVMVLSVEAVRLRIDSVKNSIGSRITISPAGSVMGVGGVPLTQSQLGDLSALPHVTKVISTMSAQIVPKRDTSLKTSVHLPAAANSAMGAVTMPVFGTGSDDTADYALTSGHSLKLVAGTMIDPSGDADRVLVGKGIAEKNGLQVGSVFRAYKTRLTVAGIFSTGNMWADNVVIFPLKSLERISRRPGQVSMVYVEIDGGAHIAAVQRAIEQRVGPMADMTTTQDLLNQAVGPLKDVERIATDGLIVCLAAGALIILLSMLLIVRERRREIGVLKAIGCADGSVVRQFVAEALVLALLGSAVGGVIGALMANSIFRRLMLESHAVGSGGLPNAGTLAVGFKAGWGAFHVVTTAASGLQASVGFGLLIYGLLVALAVAVVGSAVPAWLIAKVRPAEAMRGE